MQRKQVDTPFTKWNQPRKKPEAARKHDALCITQSKLSYCWCKCPQCWDPLCAKCICAHCSC